MDANFTYLWAAAVEAVELLGEAARPLDPHVHHARAVLVAALHHLSCELAEEDWVAASSPAEDVASRTAPMEVVSAPAADDDLDPIDDPSPSPRSLADYREARGMTVLEFGRWLGIAHFEYAAAVHRRPVDRRIRDQIAYKLGVPWRAIAEFRPAQPKPLRDVLPLPAPPNAKPLAEPWYLIDAVTGRIRSGPHHEPLPANACFLLDELTVGDAQLVCLYNDDGPGTEEEAVPPAGYRRDVREWLHGHLGADDDAGDVDDITNDYHDHDIAHVGS